VTSAARRRLLLGGVALCAGWSVARRAASADFARPLEVGLMPYLPTATLINGHQPLRRFLEIHFRRPVALSTAPDFYSFQRRVVRGDFNLILTGPSIGWQAHLDAGFRPVAVSQKLVVVQILVAKDSPIQSLEQLRGQTVATIDPMTYTAQTTVIMLREHGLTAGRDVQLRHEKVPFNSAQAVALGEVAAAGFPNVSWPALTPEIRDKLRILKASAGYPGVMFMSREAADIPSPAEFQTALLTFARDTEAGRAFVKEFNHEGLLKPDLKALRTLERFVPEVRRLLAQP
jgi:phosphonate transport system substrate-binding protein